MMASHCSFKERLLVRVWTSTSSQKQSDMLIKTPFCSMSKYFTQLTIFPTFLDAKHHAPEGAKI